MSSSVDEADVDIIVNLEKDFANTVAEMLGNLRSRYSTFKQMSMVPSILNELNTLSAGVTGMTDKLDSVLPVCNFLVI